MKKLIMIPMIYLSSFALLISCSKENFSQKTESSKKEIENIQDDVKCTQQLISALGYTPEQYTERVMECNILKLQSLDASIRKIKGQRRIEIVYLNVKCDEIARILSQYNSECKKSLRVSGL